MNDFENTQSESINKPLHSKNKQSDKKKLEIDLQ